MQTEINFGPPHPNPNYTSSTILTNKSVEDLIQERDWGETPLGPFNQWSQPLRSLFQFCKHSQNAVCIFWGEKLHTLFNGVWYKYFGGTFEIGKPAEEFFEMEWQEVIEPALEQVLTSGEAVNINNFYWTEGINEDCCYDLTLNPIRNEDGEGTEGILVIANDVTERIKAKKVKNKIEDALKIDTVAIDFFNLEGEVLEANEGFLQMTGFSREDLNKGKVRWDEMTPAEYMPLTEKAAKELKEKGHTDPYEKEYYRKDNSRWWGLFSSQMLEDGTGVEFIVDITERKKNELKYRTLFNSIDEAFCIIQMEFDEQDNPVDYRYLEVNPAFKKLTGLEGIEDMSTRKLLPDHEDYWYERYGEIAIKREPVRFEEYSQELDRVYDVFAFPYGNPKDKKIGVLFSDITGRREAEQERREILQKVRNERQRLLEIFQHAPSFMCILRGPNHVFERANDLYYKLVGDRDLLDKPLTEALPEVKGQEFPDILDQVYETGEPAVGKGVEFSILRNSDNSTETRYLDYVYQPYRDLEGNIKGVFVQGVDMTERIEAEKKLKSINENLEERVQERTESLLSYQDQLRSLASKLSKAEELERQRLAGELHDNLGQMLAVSKMKVDLLRKNDLPVETVSDVEELRELLDDALTYTRELMSDLKPPPSLDHEGIKANIDWIAKKMEKHDLQVSVQDDGQHKPVNDDIREVLVQCIRELLFNIIKHAGVDEARIKLARVDNDIHVVVEDEGKGFDPKTDRSSSLEGGFGLFNISERIDLLGGNMEIESEPGKGTKVSICAPLTAEAQKEQELEEEEADNRSKPKSKPDTVNVLLVDDHEMMREGLRKIVNEQDDLKVIAEASDGKEALKKAREVSPNVVVMDVNMPVMDGIVATQQLSEELPNIRVIALSLHDHQNVIDSMRSAGATAYLTKNEAFETLCATIRSEAKMIKD